MRNLFFLLAYLALTLPGNVRAQTAVDTVWVTVEGPLATTTITTVERRLQLGDTIQFVAVAQDLEGDPVTAVFTWASSDPTSVLIDPETGIALAIGKSQQPVGISVLTEQVSELFLASFRDGALNWSGNDTIYCATNEANECIEPRPTLQYCAYLVNRDHRLVAQSPGPPTCPLAVPPAPVPSNSVFASVPRVRSFEWSQVRPDPG